MILLAQNVILMVLVNAIREGVRKGSLMLLLIILVLSALMGAISVLMGM